MIMSRSRDWNELQHTWIEWRRRTGQKVRDMFEQLVDVSNQAALLNSTFLTLNYVSSHSWIIDWIMFYYSCTIYRCIGCVWNVEISLRISLDEVWIGRRLGTNKTSIRTTPCLRQKEVTRSLWARENKSRSTIARTCLRL